MYGRRVRAGMEGAVLGGFGIRNRDEKSVGGIGSMDKGFRIL